MAKTETLVIRLSDDVAAAVDAYKEREFLSSRAEAGRLIIEHAIAKDGGLPTIEAPEDDELDRKRKLENALLENKLALQRKELLPREELAAWLAKDFGDIKMALDQLPNSVTGLTDEQRQEMRDTIDRTFKDLQSMKGTAE